MAEISKSTFNGAAADEVAAVDVYQTVSPAVRNTFNKTKSAFGQSFDYALSRGSTELTDIAKLDTSKLTKSKGKEPSEEDQLKDILKGGKGKFNEIAKDTKAFLLETLGKNTNSESVEVSVGDELSKMGIPDIKDSEALGAFITDLTGESFLKIVNTGAKVAITGFILKQITDFDMGDALDQLLDKLDKKEVEKAIRSQPRTIISAGNIDTVETYIRKLGANTLLANYPDMPRHVIQQYRFKEGVTPVNYPALLIQLLFVMDSLMPNWIQTERNEQTVWNLGIINAASDDALILLKSSTAYRIPAMIAPHYPIRDTRSLMREQYPMIALI